MKNEITEKISIFGIVQGVGFRPSAARLADRLEMKGSVRNAGGLVEIVLTDSEERIGKFLEVLQRECPPASEIVHIRREKLEKLQKFTEFTILHSGELADEIPMIPADLAICPDCLADLQNRNDKRYRYPFISCMSCGPRYTIIDRLPYDRGNTAMDDFPMCDFCHGQYTDRQDRRYHAQTISCHDCGPQLLAYSKAVLTDDMLSVTGEQAIQKAVRELKDGRIIAVKCVGGYNLVVSPFCHEGVKLLRELKGREEKPFAVMFADERQIREYCDILPEEEALLKSSARPIVLLETREKKFSPLVNRSSRFTGCFLPSLGLQYLLIGECGPLIFTSCNLSDAPMIRTDEEMFSFYEGHRQEIAGVYYHTRDIRLSVDDSVVRIVDGRPQLSRRAKGYAPVPCYIAEDTEMQAEDQILALGGQLKSAFTLTKGNYAYVSQYFGDLDGVRIRQNYRNNITYLQNLFSITPGLVVTDRHPRYYVHDLAEEYAREHQIPMLEIQHHHAHVASVMAEHSITGRLVGVSMDGTGYGNDGTIWGGEFLVCEKAGMIRAAHLESIPMIGGDSSMKDGWKTAMCYLVHMENIDGSIIDESGRSEEGNGIRQLMQEFSLRKDSRYALVEAALAHRVNSIENSSMGRLFDAVSALLGICQENSYEGECAIMLENAAAHWEKAAKDPYEMEFTYRTEGGELIISAEKLILRIAEGIRDKVPADAIALGFHHAVGNMIGNVVQKLSVKYDTRKAALTGGVFQNKILMEYTLWVLREKGFDTYYNISVSPGDGGISLGQAYLGMHYLKEQKDSADQE